MDGETEAGDQVGGYQDMAAVDPISGSAPRFVKGGSLQSRSGWAMPAGSELMRSVRVGET